MLVEEEEAGGERTQGLSSLTVPTRGMSSALWQGNPL